MRNLLLNLENQSKKLLYLLVVTDILIIIFHVLFRLKLLVNKQFDIYLDLGYSELFQYVKEFWITLLLIHLGIIKKQKIYFAWALLFLYFLLDDSLQIHENFGAYLVEYFNFEPNFGLRAQDFGELTTTFFAGLALFSLILIGYYYSDNIEKTISRTLFKLILFLAFFGVFLDMAHIAIPWIKGLATIEDGGEMIIMSLILTYVFNLEIAYPKIKNN